MTPINQGAIFDTRTNDPARFVRWSQDSRTREQETDQTRLVNWSTTVVFIGKPIQ